MHIKYGLNVLNLCLLVVSIPFLSYAGEFSISDHSSVIGRNTGYPQGTTTNGVTETGNLDLIMETTVYAKNLELVSVDINGEDIDGETFIGSITPLRLRYRPHSQLTLEGGVLLAYDFGDGSDFDEVEPILRLVYQPRVHIFVVAGTIIRTHSIHDAIYNDTAAFMENNEQGFQLRADLKHIKQDLWINWRVREEDNVSERFDSASTTQIRIGDFRFDGQLLLRHTGGQKNTEDKLEFNTAYLVGGSYGFFERVTVPVLNVVEEMRIGAYFIGSSEDPDDQSGLPASDGNGIEGSLMFRTRPAKNMTLHIFGSYFNGDNLVARAGDPLYSADEYIQIGSNFLFELAAGLKFEISGVAQLVDGTFVHTEQMYFSWGKGFTIFRGM
jgi:hypothetical protein